MNKWKSQFMQLPFFGGSLPNLQMLRMVRIILLLLVLCSVFPFLFASESADNEIPGPESGYIYAGWQPDDRVMPIKWEGEFIPDKAHYATGEILTVRVKIWVDKESRGYKPDRTYYLESGYVEGKQLNSFVPRLTWVILKSEIDTLEIMTDDRILEGDITVQLIRRGSKPKVKKSDSGAFLTLAPMDTTYTDSGTYSSPPIMKFDIFRIYKSGVSPQDRQLVSKFGDFKYDLCDTINMYGKQFNDVLQQYDRLNYNDKTDSSIDNTFLPDQPNFLESAGGGIWGSPIKVLKNSVLRWRIANEAVALNHLDSNMKLPLSKLLYELHNQDTGLGDTTQTAPASCRDDKYISHKLDKEYEIIPHIILTNQCNCFLYIFDIKQEGTQITITLAIGNNFDADLAKYQLLALPY